MRTRQRPTLLLGAAVVVIAVSWIGVAFMGGGGADRSPETDALTGVCETLSVASAGGDVRRPFYDDAHDGLHALAADVTDLDRSVAARLLRAKERVESALDERFPQEQITAMVQNLAEATQEAVRVVDPSSEEGCP